MAFTVKRLKQNRRFQHVVNEIEAAVLTGDLRPGDQLPPELELKEMFGVGRGTLREALRVLEEKGLIIIKAGAAGGAFVQKADPAKLTEHLNILVQARSIASEHVQQFREIIEPVAANLAAAQAPGTDTTGLTEALALAERAYANEDPDNLIKGDVAVHVAIAELTGNPLLIAVLKMVHEHILNTTADYTMEGADTPLCNIEDLRGLVAAITAGDTAEAERLGLDHVQKYHMPLADQKRE